MKEQIPKLDSQKMNQDKTLNVTVYGMKCWQAGNILQAQECVKLLLASLAKAGVITRA